MMDLNHNRSFIAELIVQVFPAQCRVLGFAIALAFTVSASTQAQQIRTKNIDSKASDSIHWSSFRNGGKSYAPDDAAFPSSWKPKEGISWQKELPGYGQSSPLVIDDKVLLTAVEGARKETNLVVCLNRKNGKEVWRASQPSSLTGPSNYMYSRAAPTPVANADQVIAFFESGDVVAVGMEDGKIRWERDLKDEIGVLKSRHGLGSSLAHTDDLVFINLEHDGPSALFAIQKSNGAIRWTAERPSGSSWSSPVVMHHGDDKQVIVSSAGEVVGYDCETGKKIWNVTGLSGNSVPSPLVDGDRIYLGARKSEFGSVDAAAKSNLCLEFEEGNVTPKVVWRSKRCIADYCSPVIIKDCLFLINGSGVLGCLDKNTGQELYRKRLGFECWATPIVRGNQLFVFGKNGESAVIEAGSSFKKVCGNQLWDSANPPQPVSYVEYFPEKGNRQEGASSKPSQGHAKSETSKHGSEQAHSHGVSEKPGAAMLAGMLRSDKDGDGALTGDEIPKRLLAAMKNIDLNQDGRLDQLELEKMAKSFAEKRANSKDSSRDPIVYGVAADSNGILIRTGTRVYAVEGDRK